MAKGVKVKGRRFVTMAQVGRQLATRILKDEIRRTAAAISTGRIPARRCPCCGRTLREQAR